MKPVCESAAVVTGQNPLIDTLEVTTQITGTPKGAATLTVDVQREDSWRRGQTVSVSLSRDFAAKKLHTSLGIKLVDDVTSLRTKALKAAQEFWGSFTLDPLTNLREFATVRPELTGHWANRIHVDIAALPMGLVKIWGVVTFRLQDGALDYMEARVFTQDPEMAPDTGYSRQNAHGVIFGVKSYACGSRATLQRIAQMVRPLAEAELTATLSVEVEKARVASLQGDIEEAKGRMHSAHWTILRAENAIAMAHARIEDPAIKDAGECRECHLPVYRAKDGNLFHLNVQWTATPDEVTAGEKGHAPKLDEGRAA